MKKILIILFAIGWVNLLYAQEFSLDTTLTVKNQAFWIITEALKDEQLVLKIHRNLQLVTSDTIDSGGLHGIKFPDLNKDGNKDLMLSYLGNNEINFLYLFDPVENKFKTLEGFDKYPQAIQVIFNKEYYYSYHRAGCADYNWVSDLFKIENFRTIQIGHIYGQGCDIDKKAINIYKIIGNSEENKILIRKMPYKKNIRKFEDKWMFIEKYWNENYHNFE